MNAVVVFKALGVRMADLSDFNRKYSLKKYNYLRMPEKHIFSRKQARGRLFFQRV